MFSLPLVPPSAGPKLKFSKDQLWEQVERCILGPERCIWVLKGVYLGPEKCIWVLKGVYLAVNSSLSGETLGNNC